MSFKNDQIVVSESNSLIQQTVLSFILTKQESVTKKRQFNNNNNNSSDYELCPRIESNKFNSNISKQIQKSSSSISNSKITEINIKTKKMMSQKRTLQRTSSKKVNNSTYIINRMAPKEMKRQEALSTLSISAIDCDLNTICNDESNKLPFSNVYSNNESNMCTSCVRTVQCCEYCNNNSTSIPSQLTMESINNDLQQNYDSFINDTNLLSSTPMLPVKNLSTNKPSSNPFTLIRNCILPKVNKTTKNKKIIKKEFKIEQTSNQQIRIRKTVTKHEQITVKRVRKSVQQHRKYKLPRTSSFNSNSDEMEMMETINDFQLNNQNNDNLFESVLPVTKNSQNFNNYGDFVVWYV